MKLPCLAAVLGLLSGCATLKDNAVLQQMADQDQYDRLHDVPTEGAHDAAHQQQVRQLLAARQLRTGRDYFNAAIILQHADSASDYRQAHELAQKAVQLNPHDRAARTLVAQSWDRYQRCLGLPQWYGTQRYARDGHEYLQLLDTTKVTDAERQTYFVATLPEKLVDFNKRSGRHETSLRAYMLTNEQQRSLEQRGTGVELLGSGEELNKQIRYPAAAREHGIVGKVVVEATVAPAGTVSQANVVKGLGYGCDEEALRVMKAARFSNPTGEAQDVRFSFPFAPPTRP